MAELEESNDFGTKLEQQNVMPRHLLLFVCWVGIMLAVTLIAREFTFLWRLPSDLIIPAREWVTDFFAWLGNELDFGLFKFKDITRGFAWLLSWPLYWSEVLLFRGWNTLDFLLPIPWPVAVVTVGIIGHWAGGWRLALFTMSCTIYLVIFSLWTDSMRTFSLVLVAVPIAASIGLFLGIASTRNKTVETVLKTVFDFMQATPHMAYLAPIIVLFGFGQVPAMMATVIFAMPNMARTTILGLQTISPSVIDAAVMSGCTKRQRLWKVEIPAASNTLLLGLNQVIMQTLAMAVIASLVGASGLGQKLLFSLQQLRIGVATEQGIAIVLLAIILDRITQAAARKQPGRRKSNVFWRRHIRLLILLGAIFTFECLSLLWEGFHVYPKEYTLSFGSYINDGIRWFSLHFYPYIKPFRDWMTVHVLLNIRNFYLTLPWMVMLLFVFGLSWYLGNWRLIVLNICLTLFVLFTGFWKPAMMTLYVVNIAVVICACIGIPVGIWSAHNERVAKITMAICDTLQTFPSFIYLIPVIMIFKVGDLSNIIAILAYATVPSIRYTYLGLCNIRQSVLDAATTSGCTKRQKLWKVELPIALPEIMLGINQTVMMALAMTAITALIGSRDLGQEILKALPTSETGRGLLAGLCIAFIGIITDRLIHAWAAKRKKSMGMQ